MPDQMATFSSIYQRFYICTPPNAHPQRKMLTFIISGTAFVFGSVIVIGDNSELL
jgi:hypothetical protein